MAVRGQVWAIVYDIADHHLELRDPAVVEKAIARVARVVPEKRIVAVVTPRAEARWGRALESIAPGNRLRVPFERGAPAAILLAFFKIFRAQPTSRILIVPAQHIAADEEALVSAFEQALASTPGEDNRAVLLAKGMLAAGTSALLRLYDHALPGMLRSFLTNLRGTQTWSDEMLTNLFRFVPKKDLERDLLAPSSDLLRVLWFSQRQRLEMQPS